MLFIQRQLIDEAYFEYRRLPWKDLPYLERTSKTNTHHSFIVAKIRTTLKCYSMIYIFSWLFAHIDLNTL